MKIPITRWRAGMSRLLAWAGMGAMLAMHAVHAEDTVCARVKY